MLGTVERVCTVAPQVHVISVSMDTGWCAIFIGPPLTAACSESSVIGIFRGHTILLVLLWDASIPCDGVRGRPQTACHGSHPLDAVVTEHLTSEQHFSGLVLARWQSAASRHLSGQRKSRSSRGKSGLQRSITGGTLVTRTSRGEHEGRTPAPSSPLFLSEGGKRLT